MNSGDILRDIHGNEFEVVDVQEDVEPGYTVATIRCLADYRPEWKIVERCCAAEVDGGIVSGYLI